jgi:hypothetical protein
LLAALIACTGAGTAETYLGRAESARGRLVVEVYLNGAGPYPFLLDAALRRPVLEPGVATYLGLPLATDPAQARDVAGAPMEAGVAYVRGFRYAAGLENDETVPLVALGALSGRLGRPVAGLLPAYQAGLEVSLQFDPPGVSWRTLDTSALQEDGEDVVPMQIAPDGAPTVDALLNGRVARRCTLDLDLGEELALTPETLRDLGVAAADRVEIRLPGGRVVEQARIETMKVGRATLGGPLVRVTDRGNAIGLGFLRHFGVTLNYEFGRLLLSLPASPPARPPLTGYGLVLDTQADGLWRIGVAVGGPAEGAGLWPGDLLVSVDGQRLHGAPAAAAEALLVPEGDREVALTVLRAGEPITARLRPAPLFGAGRG